MRRYLLSRLDTEHFRCVTMQVASVDLQLGPPRSSKTLGKPLDMGIVEPGPLCGRNSSLWLNPRIVLRGEVPGRDRSSFGVDEPREVSIWSEQSREVVSQCTTED